MNAWAASWDDIRRLASMQATATGLPLDLVMGVIEHESSGCPWAWNPEPQYRYLWDVRNRKPFRALTAAESASEIPPADFSSPNGVPRDAEWWGQQASWGLMQVMGGVARERGFGGRFLVEIVEPGLNIMLGCTHLRRQLDRYGTNERAVAAYNAGSPRMLANGTFENQAYVDAVMAASASWGTRRTGGGGIA